MPRRVGEFSQSHFLLVIRRRNFIPFLSLLLKIDNVVAGGALFMLRAYYFCCSQLEA